jgi:hypothetical protein
MIFFQTLSKVQEYFLFHSILKQGTDNLIYLSSYIRRKNVENVIRYKVDIYIYIYIYQQSFWDDQQGILGISFVRETIFPLSSCGEKFQLKRGQGTYEISRYCKIITQCQFFIIIRTRQRIKHIIDEAILHPITVRTLICF